MEGTAYLFDPFHGDVVELNSEDALLIPKGTRHIGYNFGDVNFRLLELFAPSSWSADDMRLDVNFEGKPAFYKGG